MRQQFICMSRWYFLVVVFFTLSFSLSGVPSAGAAPQRVVPELFVADRVDNIALRARTLYWKSTCGDAPLPDRSRVREIPSRGPGGEGRWQTHYFPNACRANRVASANIAVDSRYIYWLTSNGRIVRLPNTAAVGDSPQELGRTGLTTIDARCCSIGVDDVFLFWNENNKIYRMPKAGGAIELMFDYPVSVRGLRAQAGVLFFLDAEHRLRMISNADLQNFIWFPVADGVAAYNI